MPFVATSTTCLSQYSRHWEVMDFTCLWKRNAIQTDHEAIYHDDTYLTKLSRHTKPTQQGNWYNTRFTHWSKFLIVCNCYSERKSLPTDYHSFCVRSIWRGVLMLVKVTRWSSARRKVSLNCNMLLDLEHHVIIMCEFIIENVVILLSF
jgi:hypothetical protein